MMAKCSRFLNVHALVKIDFSVRSKRPCFLFLFLSPFIQFFVSLCSSPPHPPLPPYPSFSWFLHACQFQERDPWSGATRENHLWKQSRSDTVEEASIELPLDGTTAWSLASVNRSIGDLILSRVTASHKSSVSPDISSREATVAAENNKGEIL